jgi:uncharacterized protein
MRKETIFTLFLLALLVSVFTACSENGKNESVVGGYNGALMIERAEKDFNLKNDPHSPFNRDPEAKYDKLKYFEPDTTFIFASKLYRYDSADTIVIMGTRGEQRKAVKEGYVILDYKGEMHNLNVYKSFGPQGQPYYSIWFTDLTTGKETYKIGRYLDFRYSPDKDYIYIIDFNRAYNPYCAYSELFTCPIPTKEDHLNFAIKAGEKNFN